MKKIDMMDLFWIGLTCLVTSILACQQMIPPQSATASQAHHLKWDPLLPILPARNLSRTLNNTLVQTQDLHTEPFKNSDVTGLAITAQKCPLPLKHKLCGTSTYETKKVDSSTRVNSK